MIKNLKHTIHSFFIPSEKNNYRSKGLHLNFLTYYLLAAFILSLTYSHISHIGYKVLGAATDITIEKVFQLTNVEREKNGLSPLQYNESLASAARSKGQDMFLKNYWAHYGPNGETPWDFILKSGYKYEYAGENLAKDFMYSSEVVNAWMDSPTHRANILKPQYKDIGLSVSNGMLNGEETTLVVQMFGTSLGANLEITKDAKAQEFTPTPASAQPTLEPTHIATAQGQILNTKDTNTQKFPINFNTLALYVSFFFFLFMILTITLDIYHMHDVPLARKTGNHLAHIMFIGFIVIALLVIAKGNII